MEVISAITGVVFLSAATKRPNPCAINAAAGTACVSGDSVIRYCRGACHAIDTAPLIFPDRIFYDRRCRIIITKDAPAGFGLIRLDQVIPDPG